MDTCRWVSDNEKRRLIVTLLKQPSTVRQLGRQFGSSLDVTSAVLLQLTQKQVVYCMNPQARRSRLYWLTNLGLQCQRQLRKKQGLAPLDRTLPDLDWPSYGWLCYSHRASIVKAMKQPLQAATIRRRAKAASPGIRMSANNVRDAIPHIVRKGIARKVHVPKKKHPHYELTELGKKFQRLLLDAESRARHK